MLIQWYPGHMNKASKEIKENLPHVDVIIEILDARIPFSSQNPLLKTLRGNKPCIKVFSKSDLADPELTEQWQHYMEQEQGIKTLALSIQHPEKAGQIPELCIRLMSGRAESPRLLTAMIMGIPNVGKSTLINLLAGRAIAKTGDEPAITKMQQRINIDSNMVLLDTPGMLWPNVENKNSGYRLAVTGAIKDSAISHDQVAFFAADYLLNHYPEALKARYSIDPLPTDDHALLNEIGKKRGCLRAGGLVEIDKAAKILLNEFRSGLLGKITLETPAMMAAELDELIGIRKEKEAKKKARKEKWKSRL